ncbi:hypothetical protein K1719_034754 [Acacia pycnantha]|nr:hypothetical protein K1719_034754 [Acacia pycnantha]
MGKKIENTRDKAKRTVANEFCLNDRNRNVSHRGRLGRVSKKRDVGEKTKEIQGVKLQRRRRFWRIRVIWRSLISSKDYDAARE